MAAGAPSDVTGLLLAWSQGDRAALERLVPHVERELKLLAHRYLRRERVGHTLQTTAIVNEAYLGLVDQREPRWQNRAHFFGIAAQIMRRILIDHARKARCAKRGGGALQVPFDYTYQLGEERAAELVALDDALSALAEVDRRKSQVVELRYFGGLSVEEVAEILGVHPDTVTREWQRARAFLRRELEAAGGDR
ncbi:MAG TPA: sigma-70 family RNA polymerase sigma factor [Thermoanaerobaculia bacterium]|jgi:RNA polymerase sigma factor (TIGR02999 family)|nr:sigma-70 family RNA polymerase sigma factor [Thermoanaerobaculia bacterium]